MLDSLDSPIRLSEESSQAFALAMAQESAARAERRAVAALVAAEPTGGVEIGRSDQDRPIRLDLAKLLEGRLLVQGASGAGKTWTLRRMIEQTVSQIQHIVIDPEGEFVSLADGLPHTVVDAAQLDRSALMRLAERTREHRLSIVLDLSDLDREKQMLGAAAFLDALVEADREHWHPCLVFVDEAHLFAPFGGQSSAAPSVRKASIDAVTDLMSRGRKRGLCGILATQRLARLAKSVVSDAHNFLIGFNSLDLDIRRAAETIGWETRRAFDRLPTLEVGSFVAVGPSFSQSPAVTRVGSVLTRHRGATPKLSGATPVPAGDPQQLLGLQELRQASVLDAAQVEAGMSSGYRGVRAFIREPGFSAAGRIWDALKPLVPEGAKVAELAPYLEAEPDDIAAGLALLDRYGLLEFTGAGDDRAVRFTKGALL